MRFLPSQETIFADAISEIAPRYLGEFGITLKRVDTRIFSGESNAARVTMVVDPDNAITVKAGPVGLSSSILSDAELSWILLALAPDLQFTGKRLRTARLIPREIERQLNFLIQYGGPILAGDMSAWRKVRETLEEFDGPLPDETRESWSDRLKRRADKAYADGNYLIAANAYWPLVLHGERLTREEKRRYDVANRRVEGLMKDGS